MSTATETLGYVETSEARRGAFLARAIRLPSLWILAALIFAAAAAPLIAPYEATEIDISLQLHPPSAEHWFGTDSYGMDVFSRVLYGARIDLLLALAASALAAAVGVPLGALAGYAGGAVDAALQRAAEVIQALPVILLALAILAALGVTLTNVTLVIALVNVPVYFRVVRSVVLPWRNAEFVEAARLAGNGALAIAVRHLLPNVGGPVVAQFTVNFAWAIQVIAGLSFLGLAVDVPEPEWGFMVQQGAEYVTTGQWWVAFFPGVAIFAAVLLLNRIGAGLRAPTGGGQ